MEGFLEEGGLQVLLHGVESLSGRRVVQLTDAMLLLECVACVKSVMNSTVGLQLITHSRDDVNILVKGTLEPVCEWMRGVSGVDPTPRATIDNLAPCSCNFWPSGREGVHVTPFAAISGL